MKHLRGEYMKDKNIDGRSGQVIADSAAVYLMISLATGQLPTQNKLWTLLH
jgi:hypothetical protein